MGMIDRVRGWVGLPAREAKVVDISPDLWAALVGGYGLPTKSGGSVSMSSALQVTAFYRAVMVIADGIAQLPVEIYKRSGRGAEPAVDHPLYDLLLYRPSELQDATGFFRTVVMHAVAAGNSVSYKVQVRGQVRELIPIRPECVNIDLTTGTMRPYYDLTFEKGHFATVGPEDVFHIRGPSWSPYKGLDPILVGREAIGLTQATEQTHARFHANGARPSGTLSTDAKMEPAQMMALRASWQEAMAGTDNVAKTAVLANGLKWQQISMSGVDAEHLDTRKHQIEEIARLLGVFPIMLGHAGDQSPTFASADAFLEAHVRYTLQPWIKTIKSGIETQLLTKDERREGYHVRIDTSELLRGSLKDRTEYYKAALGSTQQPGWLTPNEVREDDGWNPQDGEEMDRALQPPPPPPPGQPAPGQKPAQKPQNEE